MTSLAAEIQFANGLMRELIRHEDRGGTFAVKVRTRDVKRLAASFVRVATVLQEKGITINE